MSESHEARVFITNNTDGHASFQISHKHHDRILITLDEGTFDAAPGQTVGPVHVKFNSGINTGGDYWWIGMTVKHGTTPGVYKSKGSFHEPGKECMLKSSDDGKDMTFTVDSEKFNLNIPSGSCDTKMNFIEPYADIKHIFVLMLENRSFDHLFGLSEISGKEARTGAQTTIDGLSGDESNTFGTDEYIVSQPGVDPMPVGPGHEFLDTLEQLCGQGTENPYPDGAYPDINNSGFVANYESKITSSVKKENVMTVCNSAKQIPSLDALAREYTICDNWFSSMPGPTWPNRLFAMGASSNGLDDSPEEGIKKWETYSGFTYPNGSIFDLLKSRRMRYRLYNDKDDQFSDKTSGTTQGGSFPIVAALKGIKKTNVHSFGKLADDLLKDSYPYEFTFIEPNYGDASDDTFKNGSSQHPTDTLEAGDKLIAATYNAIRNSPLWESSLLIITYDEHGGFYDHVAPPAAVGPDDGSDNSELNKNGFKFDRLGVRVPAVVVSPLIPKNTIDHTVFDHTTILKTVENTFRLSNLTERDKHIHSLNHLFTLQKPRTDCLGALPEPVYHSSNDDTEGFAKTSNIVEESLTPIDSDDKLLPERGNLVGFLYIALKTHLEISANTDEERQAIIDQFETIKTQGEARDYMNSVAEKADAHKAAKSA